MAVLRAEQVHYLRASALSKGSPEERYEAAGVARWIDRWLTGELEEHYSWDAREGLGFPHPTPPGAGNGADGSPGGTPYMETDGLDEE
jgi:hypothetical protein